MRQVIRLFVAVIALCVALCCGAQTTGDSLPVADDSRMPGVVRPVTSWWIGEIGSAHVSDTYLTPLHYSGSMASLAYCRRQAMAFSPERFVMQLQGAVNYAGMLNPAGNAHMYDFSVDASWSMMRRWHLPVNGLSLGIGGDVALDLGMLYLSRNGNNPVSAKADFTIGLAGYASYATEVFKIPVTLRYTMSSPVAGVFFSPDYGELYYEIYLGNTSGLAHPAWWGDFFRYDHRADLQLRFSGTTLTLGYHGIIFSSKANGIVTNKTTHAFAIGISTEWLSLMASDKSFNNSKIISANY